MAMSDCEKCWETPCICGYDYETWDTGKLVELRNVLDALVKRREAGEPRRPNLWEMGPAPPPSKPGDYRGSVQIYLDDMESEALDRLAEEERAMNDKKSPEAVIKEADDLLASLPATKLEDLIKPSPLFAAEVEKDLREGNIGEIRNPDGTLVDPKSDDDD
jgi:hypothetical protein